MLVARLIKYLKGEGIVDGRVNLSGSPRFPELVLGISSDKPLHGFLA